MRRTKIVATLGPASESRDMIERLITLGVNVFRLNFSHGDHEYHSTLIRRVRAIAGRLDIPVAILQDISGPKIRVGQITGTLRLATGDRLAIVAEQNAASGPLEITVNYPEVLTALKIGDHVYFADGTIHTEVVAIDNAMVSLEVLVGGKLTSRKGVNLPVTDLQIPILTGKDRDDIAFGLQQGVEFIALSFVRSAADIHYVKEFINGLGGDTPVFAKIEKAVALDHLTEIMAVADGIMVARGDLGVELGVHRVPVIQKKIITQACQLGIPVITATQMLTSMLSSPYPTRAEVSDIANAVLDGTDAVMLSDETAVGGFPEESIRVLHATITETESIYPWDREPSAQGGNRQAIAAAATGISRSINADCIISFTQSGLSAQQIANHRPRSRIIATTSNNRTYRRLAIVWGVEPFFIEFSHINSDMAISLFVKHGRLAGIIDQDSVAVVTIGHHSNQTGTTNQVQILDRESFERLQTMLKTL